MGNRQRYSKGDRREIHAKNKVDYLHFGWVDFINGYHDVVKKFPYSVYGIITYLKNKKICKISELEELEHFYKSCHIYTHGNTQIVKYPILHYFEISIMLYYIIRNTFLLLCDRAHHGKSGINFARKYLPYIDKAVIQAKRFPGDEYELVDNIGCNLCRLITDRQIPLLYQLNA